MRAYGNNGDGRLLRWMTASITMSILVSMIMMALLTWNDECVTLCARHWSGGGGARSGTVRNRHGILCFPTCRQIWLTHKYVELGLHKSKISSSQKYVELGWQKSKISSPHKYFDLGWQKYNISSSHKYFELGWQKYNIIIIFEMPITAVSAEQEIVPN